MLSVKVLFFRKPESLLLDNKVKNRTESENSMIFPHFFLSRRLVIKSNSTLSKLQNIYFSTGILHILRFCLDNNDWQFHNYASIMQNKCQHLMCLTVRATVNVSSQTSQAVCWISSHPFITSHPFTKGSEVPPDLTAVRFLAPLTSSSTMPPLGSVKLLVFLPFRKLFFTANPWEDANKVEGNRFVSAHDFSAVLQRLLGIKSCMWKIWSQKEFCF